MKIKNYIPPFINPRTFLSIESALFYILVFFLPTQLGKHFWPESAYVSGIRIDYLSPTVYFTDILIVALVVLWLFKHFSKYSNVQGVKWSKKTIKPFSHLVIPSCFVILFLIYNISYSGRIPSGLYSLAKFLEFSFVGLYTAKFVASRSILQKAISVFSVSIIFQSLLAIFQFVNQGSVGGLFYYFGERSFNSATPGIANVSLNGELILRPYGTLPHPNVLAGYLLVGMILIMFFQRLKIKDLRLKKNLSKSIIQISSLIIGTIALFLTLSRVAILLWLLIVLYYLGTRFKKGIYIGLIILFGLAFFLSPLATRFTGISLADEAIAQRSELSKSAVAMIESNPLFGVGLGNFIPTLSEMQKPLFASTYLQPVHNIFLLVLAETGLIGLGLFIWFLWKTIQRIKMQELRLKKPLFFVFSAIIITGFFDHYWLTLQQGQLLFAFILGLCFSQIKTTTDKQ